MMITVDGFRKMALEIQGSIEKPHFEKPSFRIKNKIFATLDVKKMRACLKLSLIDQSVFIAFDQSQVYKVAGSWGKKGWTYFELSKMRSDLLTDALKQASAEVQKKIK